MSPWLANRKDRSTEAWPLAGSDPVRQQRKKPGLPKVPGALVGVGSNTVRRVRREMVATMAEAA